MVGTISIKVNAAKPECPLPPCFTVKGSPTSIRIMDTPRAIGDWQITSVKLVMKYPNNITTAKNATRVGNVWVATVDGCDTVGKVSNGYEIQADGKDEQNNAVQGYVLGRGNLIILDDDTDIARMVGKTTMRILDDIPSSPAKGDVLVVGEELKIYNGEEWVTISGGSSEDTYTKAEIDAKVDEIDSSISALADEIPTKTSDLQNDSGFLTDESQTITGIESSISELSTTVGQIQSDVSALDSSLTELDSSLTELNDLAVKYSNSEKVLVETNPANSVFTLKMNDTDLAAGNTRIVWNDGTNYIARNALRIGVPDDGETVQHIGTTNVQMGGVHNDAIVSIGGGITIFSSAEKGKTKMFMDDDRIFVTTPATVEEGQTLKAIKVANENAMSGRSVKMAKRDGEQAQEEVEEQDWHWEYVSADLPEKTSDLTNDAGFVTTADVEEEVADKRDYDDLTYGGTYDPSDAEGYYGISSWHIAGYKMNGQTFTFDTTARFKNATYGTAWNDGNKVIYTQDFSTFYLDGFGNSEPVPFTLSMDKTTYEVSFMGSEQQDITLTANLANADRLTLNSQLAPITASVSALGSSVSALGSDVSAVGASVSALASSMSAKRDYTDLTYNTTVPAETIDNSKLVWEDQDPLYNEKLTFTVNDSVEGEQHLAYDDLDGVGMWIDRSIDEGSHQLFFIQYAEDFGYDPADGKFVLVDGSDVCFQFNLQDGVNVQTFNYTSEMLESTGTLTMTFTGEPAHVVNDTIALTGAVDAVGASVSTLTSQVNANTSAISANTSAISANASAIASNASAISAVAGSLTVSGIGCSTIVLSGTYSDSTSFAYNFVIQPSA